jgi:twinkle protein
MTSKIVEPHIPCPCGKSSDAYCLYDDGHGHCFSCGKTFQPKNQDVMSDDNVSYQYVPWRGVTSATMEHFGVQTKVSAEGVPLAIAFPYGDIAKKVRTIEGKKFHSVGDMSNATLFGKDRFSAGSAKAITITEGEMDALSVFQMLGSKYPVVSVRSASSARQDCAKERDYLNSFERIYVCLDNDEAGEKATRELASLFDFNKVYHVKLSSHKDANEYLSLSKQEEFSKVWWNAKRFLPEGIVSSFDEFKAILNKDHSKEGVSYPFPKLTDMTFGIRTGEVVLITALEGRGKTEVVRAIEYHLLTNTDENIGIIHLEESKARLLKGLAGYELNQPVHLPTSVVSDDEVMAAVQKLAGRDDRLHLYSHFGSTDPDAILDAIRFLVGACGCKYVFFDHITMAVSGLGDKDERVLLDYISTRLGMMVEELDFSLFLVSHVNDDNKTRGSRNISKIADLWIDLNRDLEAPTEEERNITSVMIRKNRFGARTGPSAKLKFDLGTFTVTELAYEPNAPQLPPVN